jgi:hypothetical protein
MSEQLQRLHAEVTKSSSSSLSKHSLAALGQFLMQTRLFLMQAPIAAQDATALQPAQFRQIESVLTFPSLQASGQLGPSLSFLVRACGISSVLGAG